ncbi:MAG: copper amine oxidase [Candidatus Methanoperedens sp.]|nr:copper amine oxidase [Candidatus Methanoperedens sp.]
MAKKIFMMFILLVIGAVVFSGCTYTTGKKPVNESKDIKTPDIKIPELGSTQGINKFSSVQEIREFLKASAASSGRDDVVMGIRDEMGAVRVPMPVMATPAMSKGMAETTSVQYSGAAGTSDYSKTNVQVEGVDEADFVKNDGKYIYVLAQDKLVIVDAYPAENSSILSRIEIEGRPKDMFVDGDRLLVFTEDNNEVYVYQEYDYRPVPRYTPTTNALVYDITDRKKPQQVANYSINGNYFRSRMIGDYVYFIVKDNVYFYDTVVDVPVIKQGSQKILAPDVYYFDNPEQNYVFHTIASINIKSDRDINAKSFMMGYSDNLYVSGDNIYITYRKNLPWQYYEKDREERFYNVIVPLLPGDAQKKINDIKGSNLSSYEKWDKISSILEETYNSMGEKEKLEYIQNAAKNVEEYEVKLAQEREKTVIQKIGIEKGNIEYRAKGEVQGSLLNQFSMDESDDYFRVATTTQFWTAKGSVQYNNVYIMDKDLEITGTLEKIAPDERIYSTRFIGNRLYMVTFKRMDPLFVIDLSDPKNPGILGELKIPGFSDYLHPYDEKHIIGVGKETGDTGWGGVSIKGVKLSLFDVSDVGNPKQIDTYEIGTAGTDSEALRDHKAFLFDKVKNLLVIPVREVTETGQYDSRYGYYRQKVWQGAYVFGVTPEDGFKLKGKISHLDEYEDQQFYWNSPGAVRRSLYMDDVLYTISAKKVLMNGLKDLTKMNEVGLPFEMDKYYQYGWN